jgi:hypothetical protein
MLRALKLRAVSGGKGTYSTLCGTPAPKTAPRLFNFLLRHIFLSY